MEEKTRASTRWERDMTTSCTVPRLPSSPSRRASGGFPSPGPAWAVLQTAGAAPNAALLLTREHRELLFTWAAVGLQIQLFVPVVLVGLVKLGGTRAVLVAAAAGAALARARTSVLVLGGSTRAPLARALPWHLFRSYFQASVRPNPLLNGNASWKDAGAPKKTTPLLFCVHPHGTLALSARALFSHADALASMGAGPESARGPGSGRRRLRVVVATVALHIPMLRQLCEQMGLVVVTRAAISACFAADDSVLVYPGGAREALLATEENRAAEEEHLWLGAVPPLRAAARAAGASVVPVYVAGETEALFTRHPGRALAWIKSAVLDNVPGRFSSQVELALPRGRRLCGLPTPFPERTPLTAYVGLAMDSSDANESDAEFVDRYVVELTTLHERALLEGRSSRKRLVCLWPVQGDGDDAGGSAGARATTRPRISRL
jgi:hypothetical protein